MRDRPTSDGLPLWVTCCTQSSRGPGRPCRGRSRGLARHSDWLSCARRLQQLREVTANGSEGGSASLCHSCTMCISSLHSSTFPSCPRTRRLSSLRALLHVSNGPSNLFLVGSWSSLCICIVLFCFYL
ncbi:hypothetical protein K431DRAFT_91381 [Polychaeton citri CBS 116435]|uniref:Uncharacterized protein n=1 Tax=Polychaeton citri CBS 116435 TaxID=1314669 RepID=A0A9P4UN94_9PEZI|nr:hypothetical protein K431DRAFT_91381 [Polychaeton citri CBS 116435]